ncbi:MAG: hypothetical protein K2O28_01005 [Clostridia bacterium]|nr:hypothetical protein [Clostridia bacterium]
MKKKFLAFATACACALTGAAAFAGCGLFGSHEYELVSATVSNSEYNQDWVYLNSAAVMDVVNYPPTLRYFVDVTLKDGKGKELTGEIMVEPESTSTYLSIDNSVHMYLSLGISVEGYDDNALGKDKNLTIKLSSGLDGSEIKTGECELTATYSVVHALKKIGISEDVKTDYALNEEFAGLPMNVMYEDESTEVMDFYELIALPQYEKKSTITGFDSSRVGIHKAFSVNNFQTSATGVRSSSTVYYNVLPDLTVWKKGNSSTGVNRYTYEYYKTADMTFGSTQRNGYTMDNVTFGSVNMLLWVTQGVAINPNESTFENAMNSSSSSYAFFHAPIPAGQTAKVTSLTKTTNYYIVDYDCYEENEKVSSNTLYLVYSTSPQKMISVTLENSDKLNAEEKTLTEDFINLLWFNQL